MPRTSSGELVSSEQVLSFVSFVVISVLFARGYRAAREIHCIYKSDDSDPPSPILETIRDGSAIKVAAAGWFAILTLRGMAGIDLIVGGFDLLPVLRLINLAVAALVLDLPTRYLKMVRQIQSGDTVREPRETRETHDQLNHPRAPRPPRPGADDE